MDVQLLAELPLWFVAFLLSLTCHEAAHALAGKLGGDDTAASQVTLDPLPHMMREPIGTLVVPIASFFLQGGNWMIGWASAPYDPVWAMNHPKRAAWMAAAGPAANFTLMIIAAVAMRVGLHAGYFTLPATEVDLATLVMADEGFHRAVAMFVSVLFSINLILGCFNLLPLPPLDGNAVVPLFLNDRQRHRWQQLFSGSGAVAGLFIAWIVFGRMIGPIFRWALDGLYYGLY